MSLKMSSQSIAGPVNFVFICLTTENGCLMDRMAIIGQLATVFWGT
jgi:hypothetical protein